MCFRLGLLFVVLFFAVFATVDVRASAPRCPVETRGRRSAEGGPKAQVTFDGSDLQDDAQLFWVDFDGKEQLIHYVDAGESTGPHGTFEGHVWRARGVDGKLLLETEVRGAESSVVIPWCDEGGPEPGAEEIAWLAAHGDRAGDDLAGCPLGALLSETRVRGFHVMCVVRGQGSRLHLCVFPDALEADSCAAVIPFEGGSSDVLIERVSARLGLKPRRAPRPPMAIFSASGLRLDSEDELFPLHRMALVLIEGGHWQWPPVRIGFKRPLGITGNHNEHIELHTLSLRPRVFEVLNFIREEESERILKKAGPRLKSSGVSLKDEDRGKEAKNWRTSETSFLSPRDDPVLMSLERRVQNLTRVPITYSEEMQVLRYKEGALYEAHHDFFDPRKYQKDERVLNMIGHGAFNRQITVFMYLSDVDAGGETAFPRAGGLPTPEDYGDCSVGISSRPQRGKVIVFYSMHPNGDTDPLSLHGGCRVRSGTKYSANFWIWNTERHHKKSDEFRSMAQDLRHSATVDRAEDESLQALASREHRLGRGEFEL